MATNQGFKEGLKNDRCCIQIIFEQHLLNQCGIMQSCNWVNFLCHLFHSHFCKPIHNPKSNQDFDPNIVEIKSLKRL